MGLRIKHFPVLQSVPSLMLRLRHEKPRQATARQRVSNN